MLIQVPLGAESLCCSIGTKILENWLCAHLAVLVRHHTLLCARPLPCERGAAGCSVQPPAGCSRLLGARTTIRAPRARRLLARLDRR